VDIDRAMAVAVRAAEEAGVLLRAGATKDVAARAKGTAGDLVTDLDLAAEHLIVERIRGAFPEHQIIAEESGLLDAADASWLWLVDPLDGTNNVAIGLSNYVVGIALCQDQIPLLGVVHDPVREQTWSAVRGRGASGPAGMLAVPPYRPAACGPLLAWVQGYGVGPGDTVAQSLRLAIESRSKRLLQLWAPLLAWVMLARGDIDGYVGYQAEYVDLPAGSLIAREAGAVIHRFDGSPFVSSIDQPYDRSFVAGHPSAIPDLLSMVRDAAKVRITGLPA
jgi:myo-inositol-1(or 4)-monophosphatase